MKPSSTVVFLPWQEYGHIIPTLKLASRFARDGWKVVYLATEGFKPMLESRGYHCVSMPQETYAVPAKRFDAEGPSTEMRTAWLPFSTLYLKVQEIVDGLRPVAMLIDAFNADYCNVSLDAGAYTSAYHICRDIESLDTPPLIRGYGVPKNPFSKLRVKLDWFRLNKFRRARWIRQNEVIQERNNAAQHAFQKYGYKPCPSSQCIHMGNVNATVLGPRALSQGNLEPDRYFGFCIPDAAVTERDATFPTFEERRPIVYCSFGSMSERYASAFPIFTDIIDVFGKRKHFNLIIQAGSFYDTLSENSAANIRVMRMTPQVEYLPKVDAVITHGGYGTVKESVAHHLPTLVVPFLLDQVSNARMVEDLGIGARLYPKRFDAERAHQILERLLAATEVKRKLGSLYSPSGDNEEFEQAYSRLLVGIESRNVTHT